MLNNQVEKMEAKKHECSARWKEKIVRTTERRRVFQLPEEGSLVSNAYKASLTQAQAIQKCGKFSLPNNIELKNRIRS